jgi:hypothetical protein
VEVFDGSSGAMRGRRQVDRDVEANLAPWVPPFPYTRGLSSGFSGLVDGTARRRRRNLQICRHLSRSRGLRESKLQRFSRLPCTGKRLRYLRLHPLCPESPQL